MNKANGGLDLIGKRFGRLVVKSIVGRNTQGAAVYLCVCDCGGTATPGRQNLRHGESKSCGCLRREVTGRRKTKHGMEGTRVYRIWKNMLTRCRNPNGTHWKHYGGKGVKVCARWEVFQNFLHDMGQPPTNRHSIDRIDNNGGYHQGNCRWATDVEQAANKSTTLRIAAFGESLTAMEWSKRVGLPTARIRARISRGWAPEKALSTPNGKPRTKEIP